MTDTLTLARAELQKLPAAQLCALGDAFATISDVVDGLISQVRFQAEKKTNFNEAGEIIAGLSDYITYSMEAVKSEAVRRSQGRVTATDARWLAYAHIRYEARFLDHPSSLAVVVANALVVEENANG